MSISDFLFEGRSPSSVTTYGSTTESMPRWLNEYAQGVLSRANAIGSAPYEAYGGPRLAGFTPDQQRAFEMTRSNVGAHLPYLQAAGRTTPSAIGEYMNPYTENVINRAGTLATRHLNERFLPALSAKFGSRGSDVRSSAYRRAADRGVRDITEGLNEQAMAALSGGYDRATSAFQEDARRMGTLAEQTQRLNLGDVASLEAVGAAQQGANQSSLDLAYQDFTNQRDFDRGNVDWLSGLLRGIPAPRSTSTTSTSPGEVGPSNLQQAGSITTGILGILEAMKKSRGGHVRRGPLHGGHVRRGQSPRRAYGGTIGRRY